LLIKSPKYFEESLSSDIARKPRLYPIKNLSIYFHVITDKRRPPKQVEFLITNVFLIVHSVAKR